MADGTAASQRQIRGLTLLRQRRARGRGDGGEIDPSLGRKFQLQLGRRVTQQQ